MTEKGNYMNSNKIRAGIYGMAAIYMLYTAMQLYKEAGNVVAAVFFVVAAIGLIAFALLIAKRVTEAEKKQAEEKKDDESETN